MKNWQDIIHYETFRTIDHTNQRTIFDKPNTALTSFAIDDALAIHVGEKKSPPVIRLWNHPKTVVLGIPDARLPYLEDGIRVLTAAGYQPVIRNSGGLAVVLDEAVLNISLILPEIKHISIHDCYEAMVHLIKHIFKDWTDQIQAYEIVGSYCPGDYDLSIGGKKFAGISQRRVRDGAAIQIYLDIAGDSYKRASLISKFYEAGIRGEETKFHYPQINPEVMASLSSLLNKDLTVEEVKKQALATLRTLSENIVMDDVSGMEWQLFQHRYKQMIDRNEKVRSFLNKDSK